MPTPDYIANNGHAQDYKHGAWRDYSTEELVMWIHLLEKRASHRTNEDKMHKDLHDAANYRDMLTAKLAELMGDDRDIHQLFMDAEAQMKTAAESCRAHAYLRDSISDSIACLSAAALAHSWHELEECHIQFVAAMARIMEAEKLLRHEIHESDDR